MHVGFGISLRLGLINILRSINQWRILRNFFLMRVYVFSIWDKVVEIGVINLPLLHTCVFTMIRSKILESWLNKVRIFDSLNWWEHWMQILWRVLVHTVHRQLCHLIVIVLSNLYKWLIRLPHRWLPTTINLRSIQRYRNIQLWLGHNIHRTLLSVTHISCTFLILSIHLLFLITSTKWLIHSHIIECWLLIKNHNRPPHIPE